MAHEHGLHVRAAAVDPLDHTGCATVRARLFMQGPPSRARDARAKEKFLQALSSWLTAGLLMQAHAVAMAAVQAQFQQQLQQQQQQLPAASLPLQVPQASAGLLGYGAPPPLLQLRPHLQLCCRCSAPPVSGHLLPSCDAALQHLPDPFKPASGLVEPLYNSATDPQSRKHLVVGCFYGQQCANI